MSDMTKKKKWDKFRDTGLLMLVNTILHPFGWSIGVEYEDGEVVDAYPMRVKYRGFSEDSQSEAFEKINKWMKQSADQLYEEADYEEVNRDS